MGISEGGVFIGAFKSKDLEARKRRNGIFRT